MTNLKSAAQKLLITKNCCEAIELNRDTNLNRHSLQRLEDLDVMGLASCRGGDRNTFAPVSYIRAVCTYSSGQRPIFRIWVARN